MRMRDIGLARTASSLSFTTLLAVVPMATIALAFVARFPMFESWFAALEAFVFKNMLPGSAASVIHEYVLGFAEQAARLTGVSIVLIAATAGLAISTVEREINLIWGIRRRRPLARRVLVYFVGLTAGPVLLGASISLTTWFVGESLAVVPIRKTQSDLILRMLPFVFGTAGLTLLYKVVPARRARGSQIRICVVPDARQQLSADLRGGGGVAGVSAMDPSLLGDRACRRSDQRDGRGCARASRQQPRRSLTGSIAQVA